MAQKNRKDASTTKKASSQTSNTLYKKEKTKGSASGTGMKMKKELRVTPRSTGGGTFGSGTSNTGMKMKRELHVAPAPTTSTTQARTRRGKLRED